jgi:hypothetical protein
VLRAQQPGDSTVQQTSIERLEDGACIQYLVCKEEREDSLAEVVEKRDLIADDVFHSLPAGAGGSTGRGVLILASVRRKSNIRSCS